MYLRSVISPVSIEISFLVALLFSLACGLIFKKTTRVLGLWLIVFMSSLISLPVNPVIQGAGNYYTNSFAKFVSERSMDQTWATDDVFMDAILIANGRDSLSGQQTLGPNAAKWQILDKDGQYHEFWNRGMSYVKVIWNSELEIAKISNPAGDVVQVEISPCSNALRELKIDLIATYDGSLTSKCLEQIKSPNLNLRGKPIFVYQIQSQ